MRHISPQSALRRARPRHGCAWSVARTVETASRAGWCMTRTTTARGIYGDEAKGQDEYQKRLMFRALELLNSEHDWHDYDWHLLSGPAADRVVALLERRREFEAASAEGDAWTALARAMVRQAGRAT